MGFVNITSGDAAPRQTVVPPDIDAVGNGLTTTVALPVSAFEHAGAAW